MHTLSPCEGPVEIIFNFISNPLNILWSVIRIWVLHPSNRLIFIQGMAIVAMCYYLLKEEVTVKVTYLKNKIKDKIFLMKQTKKPSWDQGLS